MGFSLPEVEAVHQLRYDSNHPSQVRSPERPSGQKCRRTRRLELLQESSHRASPVSHLLSPAQKTSGSPSPFTVNHKLSFLLHHPAAARSTRRQRAHRAAEPEPGAEPAECRPGSPGLRGRSCRAKAARYAAERSFPGTRTSCCTARRSPEPGASPGWRGAPEAAPATEHARPPSAPRAPLDRRLLLI